MRVCQRCECVLIASPDIGLPPVRPQGIDTLLLGLIRLGIDLPVGGSRLVVARKVGP